MSNNSVYSKLPTLVVNTDVYHRMPNSEEPKETWLGRIAAKLRNLCF